MKKIFSRNSGKTGDNCFIAVIGVDFRKNSGVNDVEPEK